MPGRSTLPKPSGQPSLSSSKVATYFIPLTLAGYRSLRKDLSPVQPQTTATAEGYVGNQVRVCVGAQRDSPGAVGPQAEPDQGAGDATWHEIGSARRYAVSPREIGSYVTHPDV